MVDHGNAAQQDSEIEEIQLSEELSDLEEATPIESDDEEESAGGLFGYNIFTKRNLFYLALVALAIVAIVCLCQGSDQYGCDTINAYTPEWMANMIGETSSMDEMLGDVADLSDTSQ